MVKQLLQKQVLLGPAPLRRAAATRVQLPVEVWMLRQAEDVRESYIEEVLLAGFGADGDR